MYKGNIVTATEVTAQQDIPFVTVRNTNADTSAKNGVVSFLKGGHYNVYVSLNLTGITGNIIASLYADGVQLLESVVGATSGATTDFVSLTLIDEVYVVPNNQIYNFAELSARLDTDATINSAVIVIEKLK